MNKWTSQEIDYLKSSYETHSIKEMADCLGRTINAVKIKSRKLGLKRKSRYYYSKNYFRDIVTPKQAYWLGFIYADGCVTKEKGKPNTYSVAISLSVSDEAHLKNFNKDIDGNVGVTKKYSESICKGRIAKGEVCSLRLYCSEMAMDLISHGCCTNKSLTKTAPVGVTPELMRDFIRGYFDGNGSIASSFNKKVNRSYRKVTITSGSIEFVKWLSSYLSNKGFNNSFYPDGSNCYKIQLSAKSIAAFLDYIYKDSDRYLKRKYEKYLVAVYGDDTNP